MAVSLVQSQALVFNTFYFALTTLCSSLGRMKAYISKRKCVPLFKHFLPLISIIPHHEQTYQKLTEASKAR